MKVTDCTTDSRFNELSHHIDRKCDPQWKDELRYCMPLLIDLINEAYDQPFDQIEPAIRCIISEHCQVDLAGDAPAHDDVALERHVHIVIGAMKRFHRTQCRRHVWSDVPVPPQMFG